MRPERIFCLWCGNESESDWPVDFRVMGYFSPENKRPIQFHVKIEDPANGSGLCRSCWNQAFKLMGFTIQDPAVGRVYG